MQPQRLLLLLLLNSLALSALFRYLVINLAIEFPTNSIMDTWPFFTDTQSRSNGQWQAQTFDEQRWPP